MSSSCSPTGQSQQWDNHKGYGNVIEATRSGNELHPTQKPVEILEKLLDNTQWAEGVLDTFGGSGTTLIAAESVGQPAYVIEMEPGICGRDRSAATSRQPARRPGSGCSGRARSWPASTSRECSRNKPAKRRWNPCTRPVSQDSQRKPTRSRKSWSTTRPISAGSTTRSSGWRIWRPPWAPLSSPSFDGISERRWRRNQQDKNGK